MTDCRSLCSVIKNGQLVEFMLKQKIIFLGYDRSKTSLIEKLESRGCEVKNINAIMRLKDVNLADLVICFGYRRILSSDFVLNCPCPILNLHISFLPYNRGAHPNFWSFYDGTQSGVTIHLVDEGVDTGPIIFQKKIDLLEDKTFSDTYSRLLIEAEALFMANIELILNKRWTPRRQNFTGSSHKANELPVDFRGWNSIIVDEIVRLKKIEALHRSNDKV